MQHIGDAMSLDSATQYFKRTLYTQQQVLPKYISYVIVDLASRAQVGIIGANWYLKQSRSVAEVGVMVLPEWHRKGIGHQAKTLLINYLLSSQAVTTVHVFNRVSNQAAIQANHKLGLIKGRVFKHKTTGDSMQEWMVTRQIPC